MASGYGLAGGTYNSLPGGQFWKLWELAEAAERAQWHYEERTWNECEQRPRRLHDASTYTERTGIRTHMEDVGGRSTKQHC